MRILITTDWYKPVVNGVVTSVDSLTCGLTAAGHEVRILTLSQSIHSSIVENVYYIASVSAGIVYENARVKLMTPPEILRDIFDWKPDIVHSQCEFSTFGIAREIVYKCGIPLVHTYHTVYEDYTHYFCPSHTIGKKAAKFFSKKILSDVDAVIAPSGKIECMLRKYGVHKAIYNIPSGIDIGRYEHVNADERKKLRASLGIAPDECILLYVGRLAREKNIGELLSLLAKTDRTQRMLIVGDGPYRAELEKTAEALGVQDRLIFTGMVSPQRVPDYYAAGDIFVNASQSETQGLTYMEAMLSALPVLCRADECLTDVIANGENVLLYHNKEEFLSRYERLSQDVLYRTSIGISAERSIAARYSIEPFTNSCLMVYNDAIRREGACA